jgi:hypothetical protein
VAPARSSLAPEWRSSIPGQGWCLAVGSFKAHLKLVFFDGASLTTRCPEPSCDQAPARPRGAGSRQARRSSTRPLDSLADRRLRNGADDESRVERGVHSLTPTGSTP